MKARTRKILRVLGYCFLTGVAIVVLFVGVLWLKMLRDDRLARVEIAKKLAAIHAAGQPLTAEDLAKLYPDPPPEHDAVLLLKPALAALAMPKYSTNLPFFGGDDLPKGSATAAKPILDEMQAWTDKNQKAFDAVSIADLKGAWIGCSYQNGFSNLVSAPISKIDALVQLLYVDATLEVELQHPQKAIQSWLKATAIVNAWRNDLPIHGLVKLGMANSACSTLEHILNRTVVADPDLIALSDSLGSTNIGAIKEVTVNERCFGLYWAGQLQTLARQATSQAYSPVRWLLKFYQSRILYRDQDLLNLMEWYDRCLGPLDLPLSNAIPALLRVKQDAENPATKPHVNFFNTFKKNRFSLLTLGQGRIPAPAGEAEAVAKTRDTRTGLAIERWRLTHDGNLPDSLAALVPDFLPAIPNDPFDDQPLRYKKLNAGYVVYSIGRDFTDNGGKEKPDNAKDSDTYDITFTVNR